MAAQRSFQQQVDGLQSIKELMELFKNPKSISEAAELARKEAALTQEEVEKATEARALIAQASELYKDLKSKSDELTELQSQHAAELNRFKEEKDSWVNQVIATNIQVDTRTSQLNDVEKNLIEGQKQLQLDRKIFIKESSDKSAGLLQREDAVQQRENADVVRKNALREYEEILKQKAAKIKEQLSDF